MQAATRRSRRPYRAPIGLPTGRASWRVGSVTSAAVHIGIILLLFTPLAIVSEIQEVPQGAGGPGPAGGGGGGNRGPVPERIRFMQVVQTPPPAKVEPVPVPPPRVQPRAAELPKLPVPAITASSTGTGIDNLGGTGPGSGGGTGSGTGTGTGSAVGPGTGGGTQANYPPTPVEMFIPPLPVPSSVKGFHLVAEFDVDERGRVLSLTFTQTRDRAYNRRLEDVLRSFRFKPGTRADGTPIRMKAQVVIDL